jgi:hypothetical protein
MNAANPTLYNNFLPAKTISFPFAYPNGTNGFFTASECSTLINLRNTKNDISNNRITMNESDIKSLLIPNRLDVYPTPANELVNISFSLKTTGNVRINIYDILGKEISSVINNQYVESGQYTKEINISDLSSGLYKIVLITSDGEVINKNIVIAKR